MIFGDININYNDNNRNKIQLNSLLDTYNLQSIVNFPTRINAHSSTTTDNIFIDTSKNINFTIEPYSKGLSDHDAQIFILHNKTTHNLPVCSYTKRLINISTISEFKLHLSYESWENVFTDNHVNTIFNDFLHTYLRIFYYCFPLKQFHQNHNNKNWITTGIKISSQHKRDLFLLCRSSNNPILNNHYKKYCRVLSQVIQAAKRLYYNKIISSSKNKVTAAWQIVKTETNKLPSNHNMPPLHIRGNLCHDYQVISNEFNKYFSTIAHNVLNNNCESRNEKATVNQSLNYLHHIFKHPFSHMTLIPTTPNKISKIIKSLKNKSSCGYDEIPLKIL
jgi:hypothetical protein